MVGVMRPNWALSQTFVQLADLDPQNQLGPRLTRTVVSNKLSGNPVFADLGSKTTLINAVASPWVAYEFASDPTWNRVLFGQKDLYFKAFLNAGGSTPPLVAPGGIAVSPTPIVYIADRLNGRIVLARFDPAAKTLTWVGETPTDADLSAVVDVVWEGEASPLTANYFYALDRNGRISWWQWTSGAPSKLWSYGARGTSTYQFLGPTGMCVGHSAGPDGGSRFTNDLYVADAGNRRLVWLQRITGTALWESAVTLPDSGIPADCTVDHFGNVTVADVRNSRLLKYTWNLTYLDQYGTYGTGSTNDNTFAHPHAVHAPFGTMKNASGSTIWYGEGRVITAEDWGAVSGAREHYLGINSWITAQPTAGAPQVSYFVTDHGSQKVTVVNPGGTAIRTLVNDALAVPGSRTVSWDGNTDQGTLASPSGNYKFSVVATSAYNCTQSWCTKSLLTGTFFHQGPPIASISGPSGVVENTTATWTAGVSDGVPPYTYQWTVDGSLSGTSTSVTAGGWAGGSFHAIGLTVTDALGHGGSTARSVYVTYSGGCLRPPCPK